MKNPAETKISEAHYLHLTRQSDWADKRFCFVLSGRRGSGKTTTALRAFEKKNHFYFSFRGLCADMASKLLCKVFSEKGINLQGDSWTDIFVGLNELTKTCGVVIFDDLDEMMIAVKLDGEDYIFDFAKRDKGKAVFVKIFHYEEMTVGREEYDKLERAVMRCHTFSDSHIYIFAKRRFSDSLVHEASFGIVKLFHLDRLRFRDD